MFLVLANHRMIGDPRKIPTSGFEHLRRLVNFSNLKGARYSRILSGIDRTHDFIDRDRSTSPISRIREAVTKNDVVCTHNM